MMDTEDIKGKGLAENGESAEHNGPVAVPAAETKVDIGNDPPIKTKPRLEVERDRDFEDPAPVTFWDPAELGTWSLWRAVLAELIATFLFLYIGVQTVVSNGADGSCNAVGNLGIAFAFGITIFVLVYCIGGISGGHINPAISFAMLLSRRISFLRALLYWIVQVLGGLAGAGMVKGFQKGYYQRYGGGANYVHYGYSKGAGLVAEMIGTFFLVYVVFTASDAKRKARDAYVPILAPLAIGLVIFVVHLATIPITGTGINPARSFAAAGLWDHHDHAWDDMWIFWVGPLVGAAVATLYHQFILRAFIFRDMDFFKTRGV